MTLKKSPIDDMLSHSAGYLLTTASRLLRARVETALASAGLSLSEYVVLRLSSAKQDLTQGELGEKYGIDPATMVSLIDGLENRNLVTRVRNPADRRSYVLRITPGGSKIMSRARKVADKAQANFLAPLKVEEWELVRNYLWFLISSHENPNNKMIP